jgi:hypothetical protein
MKPSKILSMFVFGLGLAIAGCQSDSPTEPGGGAPVQTPKPPVPVTTYTVNVTANPNQLAAGGGTPTNVTVEVRRTDNGQVPPDLTEVELSTTLGEFGSIGSNVQTLNLQLVNGRAQAVLYPGLSSGTATVRARVGPSAGAANVLIGQAATFFVSSIAPGVGTPAGGEQVTINGGGFDGPVRVTFNNATAQVLSVSPTQIRVRTPSSTAAGVEVPVGSTVPVTVGVTINVNETGTATDSVVNAFTYAHGGGGGVQQPQFFTISPASGINEGGTRAVIRGDGFQEPIQVFFGLGAGATFNGVEARVESVSRNEIVVVTPAARGFGQNLVDQLVNIRITNVNSGFTTLAAGAFKYGTDILITSMGPGSGPYTGGTRVTIFGQGFDAPVAVSLGSDPAIAQLVTNVSGTTVEFITSGTPISQCPANGVISVTGVSVTNIETGKTATANLGFNYVVPVPLIFGVNPSSGNIGASVTISGRNFGSNVQVLFGDPTGGSSAPIVSQGASSIVVRVPTPPGGFVFNTEPCDGNGDGNAGGTRNIPTPISVTVRNLDGTGCLVTLSNAFTVNPTNTTCTGDNTTPPPAPACSDGIDNDGDGFADFGAGPNNDPQCTSATDDNEAS